LIYKNDKNKIPWSLAKMFKSEIDGVQVIFVLVRWENKDGTVGFTGNYINPIEPNVVIDLRFDNWFKTVFVDGKENSVPSGKYINPKRNDALRAIFGRSGESAFNVLSEWYKEHPYNAAYWEQCKEADKILNTIKDSNGQIVPYIHFSPAGSNRF
jgi:hypothetical protein